MTERLLWSSPMELAEGYALDKSEVLKISRLNHCSLTPCYSPVPSLTL